MQAYILLLEIQFKYKLNSRGLKLQIMCKHTNALSNHKLRESVYVKRVL